MIHCGLERPDLELVACVRSERAASQLPELPEGRGRVAFVDFDDAESLSAAFRGVRSVIHLAGILIETPTTSYESANVETVRAALAAARAEGVEKFVLVGAMGADLESSNRYFRSKAQGERLVTESGLHYTVLRAPLVLACASEGVRAFVRETGQAFVPLVGGGHTVAQPLDARDLARGALAAAAEVDRARDCALELVGPEAASMRELIARGAALRGRRSRVLSVPRWLAATVLWLRSRVSRGGLTPTVLDVMMTDVSHDPKPAAVELGLELTPLEETLRASLEMREEG